MFGTEIYANLRNELDRSYQIQGRSFEIDNIKISNKPRTRNFIELIRILSENEYCTAKEIAEKDNLSKGKIRMDNRQDSYYRLITGDKSGKILGLIEKDLIEPKNSEWWKTKNNKFRLTFFGVLYSIRLFSERPVNFGEVKNSIRIKQKSKERTIIDILSKNYSDKLPLIFRKWKFFEEELPKISNLLYFIAHHIPISTDLLNFTFFDPRPFDFEEFENESDDFQNEFTILFLGYLYIAMSNNRTKFQKILSKEEELYTYYKKYLSILDKVHRLRRYDTKIAYYTLTGQFSKIDNMREKMLDLKGRPSTSELLKIMESIGV